MTRKPTPKDWEDCICGNKIHTSQCKRNHYENTRRNLRHKLRKEHRCIWCGIKVKPIIIYHQFCPKHKPKTWGGNLIW